MSNHGPGAEPFSVDRLKRIVLIVAALNFATSSSNSLSRYQQARSLSWPTALTSSKTPQSTYLSSSPWAGRWPVAR